jgi:hypothetical protein
VSVPLRLFAACFFSIHFATFVGAPLGVPWGRASPAPTRRVWLRLRRAALHHLPYADCFAAALAQARKATLVTSDKDFQRVGTCGNIL